ncbi:hypothetical protein HK101_006925, partial [Irineochytrium annulatum]
EGGESNGKLEGGWRFEALERSVRKGIRATERTLMSVRAVGDIGVGGMEDSHEFDLEMGCRMEVEIQFD